MRVLVAGTAVAAIGLALAGCSKQDTSSSTTTTTNTTTPAAAGAGMGGNRGGGAGGFTPPTSVSRADYGGRIERRFRKLDANGDGKLEKSELPAQRADRMIRRMDKNADGVIDAKEWSDGMLARFDRQDTNHDGNLTSDERGKRGGGMGGRRRAQQQMSIPDEGDEVDNTM